MRTVGSSRWEARRERRLPHAAALLLAQLALLAVPCAASARRLTQAAAPAPAGPGTTAAGGAALPPSLAADAALLLDFKASLDNGATVLGSWRPGSDPCAWKGIACSADGAHVESLALVDAGIVGTIPQPNGWQLPPKLKDLQLCTTGPEKAQRNRLAGPLPPGWRLPDGLTLLCLSWNPLGGSIPSDWLLPDSLAYLIIEGCNFTGPLPADFKAPSALLSWNMNNNEMTGTIPASLTRIPSIQVINLDNNRLQGQIPPAFQFNLSNSYLGLSLVGNNISGPIPSWPDSPNTGIGIKPGNPLVCGPLPKPWPRLIDDAVPAEIKQLPPCDPATGVALAGWQADGNPAYEAAGQEGTQEGSGGGGASTGVIVGATLGAVAGAALVLGAVLLVLRRRHPRRLAQAAAGDAKGGLPSGTASEEDSGCPPMQPSGSWTPPSSEAAAAAAAAATAAAAAAAAEAAHPPALPANPFAADARGRGALATTWPSPSWPASSARLSLSDASTQLTAGGGSGSATLSAEHRSKLEALQAEAPGWLIPPTRLSLDQGPNGQLVLLGRGGFGRVYRGFLDLPPGCELSATLSSLSATLSARLAAAAAGDGQRQGPLQLPVAIKVLENADIPAFIKEAGVMHRLSGGERVVSMIGASVVQWGADSGQLLVVLELMEGGDLRAALSAEGAAAERLRWHAAGRQVALDIAAGLAWLHRNRVTHRDLKSRNVLLSADLRAKVADCGGAVMHSATHYGSSAFQGTLAWAAPELLMGQGCTQKVDIYSFGVVLWELATQEVPQRGHVQPPPPSHGCPPELSQLIADCLRLEPAERPTAQEALARLRAMR